MRIRTILLVLALLLPCVALAANVVYRWKDANGVVHFADAPPPQGIKYKIVNINTGVSRDPVKPAAPARAASAAPADSAAKTGGQANTLKDTPENRAKLCARLAENIKVLQGDQIATLGNSTTPMTAEQRAEQLAQAQAKMKQYCTK